LLNATIISGIAYKYEKDLTIRDENKLLLEAGLRGGR